MKKNKI